MRDQAGTSHIELYVVCETNYLACRVVCANPLDEGIYILYSSSYAIYTACRRQRRPKGNYI
jgi:hypothetical protein